MDTTGAKFNRYSQDYEELLTSSARLFGEAGYYFAKAKANQLARKLGREFAGKILDFGCGIGLLSRALIAAMPNCTVHGFDLSSASIEAIPSEIRDKGLFTTRFSELDRDYGVVVLANVLHHVAKPERQDVLSSTTELLSPRGRCIVFEHNPANPLTRWCVSQCSFDEDAILLWPRELSRYFRIAGFSDLTREFITFFPGSLARLRRFEPLLWWCPAGGQYVITGTFADADARRSGVCLRR